MMGQLEMMGQLAGALAAAQAEMKNAPLNKVNPHFKSKYADLAAIRDAVTPSLAKHGIAVTQLTETEADRVVVVTMLIHESGETVLSRYPIALDTPQKMGSQITYARRYCLAAMCNIAAEEDDDGNAAEKEKQKPPGASVRAAAAPPAAKEVEKAVATGSLGISAMKKWCTTICNEIRACTDLDQLNALWTEKDVAAALDQMKTDLPDFWRACRDTQAKQIEQLTPEEKQYGL
jgi:hypothetical protein